MKLKVNGKDYVLEDGITIAQLLQVFGVNPKLCVVEKNKNIIKRERYEKEKLSDGDEVEIVTLVGGG